MLMIYFLHVNHQINEKKEKWKCKYLMSDMGSLKHFLGVKIEQREDSVFLSQTA